MIGLTPCFWIGVSILSALAMDTSTQKNISLEEAMYIA